MGATGNRVTGVDLVRGFESLPLRFRRVWRLFEHRLGPSVDTRLLVLRLHSCYTRATDASATVLLDQSTEYSDKQHRRSEPHVQADGDASDLRLTQIAK
jgi:hypothetical protein